MQDTDRKLSALAYALGWTAVIMLGWVTVAYVMYLGRITGRFWPLPDAWFPSPAVHLIFIGIAKLIAICMVLAWLVVLLYRNRLRSIGKVNSEIKQID